MNGWEYLKAEVDWDDIEHRLDLLGAEGWEVSVYLGTVIDNGGKRVFLMKRPIGRRG